MCSAQFWVYKWQKHEINSVLTEELGPQILGDEILPESFWRPWHFPLHPMTRLLVSCLFSLTMQLWLWKSWFYKTQRQLVIPCRAGRLNPILAFRRPQSTQGRGQIFKPTHVQMKGQETWEGRERQRPHPSWRKLSTLRAWGKLPTGSWRKAICMWTNKHSFNLHIKWREFL